MFAANRSCLARHDVVPGLIRPGLTLLAGEDGQGRDAPAAPALGANHFPVGASLFLNYLLPICIPIYSCIFRMNTKSPEALPPGRARLRAPARKWEQQFIARLAAVIFPKRRAARRIFFLAATSFIGFFGGYSFPASRRILLVKVIFAGSMHVHLRS
jgi:hypothetical protein